MLRESGFLRRLRQELPVWVQQGWVTPESEQQILNHAAAQRAASGVAETYSNGCRSAETAARWSSVPPDKASQVTT